MIEFNNLIHKHSLAEGVMLNNSVMEGISLVVGGDFAPVGKAAEYILEGKEALLLDEKIREEILSSDLAIVNLECPLTGGKGNIVKDGPVISADPGTVRFLRHAGFEVASLANNHIMDRGAAGLWDTMETCRKVGISTVGAGINLEEAGKPLYLERKGIVVAVIAVAEHEFAVASKDTPGANPADPLWSNRTLQQACAHADFVLVVLHGGNEYYPYPRPGLVDLCRYLVDQGAHAVVCHHPHVAGGMEIYKKAPLVYSTGNFLFDVKGRPPEWYRGYLVRLEAARKGVNSFRVIPFSQCATGPGISVLNQAEKEEMLGRITGYSAVISDREALQRSWEFFCRSKRDGVLYNCLVPFRLRGMKRLIQKWPILLKILTRKPQLVKLLSQVRCESHREMLIEILEQEIKEYKEQRR